MLRYIKNRSKLNFPLSCEMNMWKRICIILWEWFIKVVVFFLLNFILWSIPNCLDFVDSFPFPYSFPYGFSFRDIIFIIIIFNFKVILFKCFVLFHLFFTFFAFLAFFAFFTFFFIKFDFFFISYILFFLFNFINYLFFIFFLFNWNFPWYFLLNLEVNGEIDKFRVFFY